MTDSNTVERDLECPVCREYNNERYWEYEKLLRLIATSRDVPSDGWKWNAKKVLESNRESP